MLFYIGMLLLFLIKATVDYTQKTRKLSSTEIFDNNFVNLSVDDVVFPGGTEGTYAKFSVKPGLGSVVIARHVKRGISYFAFINQHRYVIGENSIEFPRGSTNDLDADEAIREFTEETGLTSYTKPIKLGEVYPDTGILVNKVAVWLTNIHELPFDIYTEQETDGDAHWITEGEFSGMIRNGKVTCGLTLSSWALFKVSDYAVAPDQYSY